MGGPRFSLAWYIEGIVKRWPERDIERMIVSGLPRGFHARGAAEQREALAERVPLTHTKWDALPARILVVGDVRGPTVSSSHNRVEGVVRIGEPLRAGVVEVRQRALLQRFRCVLVAGNRPLRIEGTGVALRPWGYRRSARFASSETACDRPSDAGSPEGPEPSGGAAPAART